MNKTDYIAREIFKFYGCNCESECPKVKSNDNLYLIGLNYRGLYEDDDCSFWYLNSETGEVVSDTWSTRYAAPNFSTFLRMTVPAAHEAGYISDEVYNSFVDARWKGYLATLFHDLTNLPTFLSDFTSTMLIGRDLNIPVSINRGRKYRGNAILLKFVKEADGPWVYRNRGYHLMAQILGNDNRIYLVRPSYIDATDTMVNIDGKLKDILKTNPEDTAELTGVYPFMEVDTSTAVDDKEEKKQAKYNAFKESKMPGLIEWCRAKAPEKTEEEIKAWAEKIFAKNHPMR